MKKIGEIIERVQNFYIKGGITDTTDLSNRLVYSKLLTVRERMMSQELKKKQKISNWSYQTLPCVKLINIPAHACPCITPIGCEVLRSEHKLPNVITGLVGEAIKSVTSIERSIKIDRVEINSIGSQKGNKYTALKTNFFIHDDYLYLTTNTGIKVVTVLGLFADPVEASRFKTYCDDCEDCQDCIDYMEEVFPIEGNLIDGLVELTIAEVAQSVASQRAQRAADAAQRRQENSR